MIRMSKRYGKPPKKQKTKKHVLGECQCAKCKVTVMERVVLQDHNALVNLIDLLVKEKIIKVPPHAKVKNMKTLESFMESEEDE
jgi:hypothetical protein